MLGTVSETPSRVGAVPTFHFRASQLHDPRSEIPAEARLGAGLEAHRPGPAAEIFVGFARRDTAGCIRLDPGLHPELEHIHVGRLLVRVPARRRSRRRVRRWRVDGPGTPAATVAGAGARRHNVASRPRLEPSLNSARTGVRSDRMLCVGAPTRRVGRTRHAPLHRLWWRVSRLCDGYARLLLTPREQGVGSSNFPAPTNEINDISDLKNIAWVETWADSTLRKVIEVELVAGEILTSRACPQGA